MENQQNPSPEEAEAVQGLPMFTASDPEALAKEKAELAEIAGKGFGTRMKFYFSRGGPGWLQSAMTLGGGSAMASLYLGSQYGYKLLWVQPLAMAVGIIMLMAASYQTLSTGIRPFDAMRRYVHPGLAWAWVIATLLSTIIWHLPQYALAAGVIDDMGRAVMKASRGAEPSGATSIWILMGIAIVVMIVSTAITWAYGKGGAGVRLYEKIIRYMVMALIASFAVVVVISAIKGKVEFGKMLKGLIPFSYLPDDRAGMEKVIAAFGAAVGINMTFLFGYSLLARGWGKEHREMSRFDLIGGMFLPFVFATGLIVVACACTLHGTPAAAGRISPAGAGKLFTAAGLPDIGGRFLFGLGILGMALSTITVHMLVSGFSACEVFGVEPGGLKYKLFCLIPAPAFLGVILWSRFGTYIAIPTSAACAILLPIAYIGWLLLQNSKKYLGDEKPTGGKASAWNLAMAIAVIAAVAAAFIKVKGFVGFFFLR
jgi:Mn2+/Fe2+ NRAMP family transporter